MKLREQLLLEHSKTNCDKITQWVGTHQDRFDALFQLFLNDEYRVVQSAAWPLSCAVMAHPSLIKNHFSGLLKNLDKPGIHDAVKRNSLRLLQVVPIPKKYQGRVMDLCFNYIATPGEKVAIKAFALTVLQNLSIQYPEIIPEIKLLVEDLYDHESTAFKVRARRFLQSISKL